MIRDDFCVLQQARAEQEEEFISNTLLKKIQELRREKEKLAMNYEQEEECLTNDLSRKLTQVKGGSVFIYLNVTVDSCFLVCLTNYLDATSSCF